MSHETKTSGCLCPGGQRHPDGETIVFRDTIDFRTALTARKAISWMKTEEDATDVPDVLAMLSEFYLTHLIEAWSLRDAKGKPIEVSRTNIEDYVLSSDEAFDLAEFADGLYSDRILGPLAPKASTSSRRTPKAASTSPTSGRGTSRPKSSTPSLTEPTPMVATGRT